MLAPSSARAERTLEWANLVHTEVLDEYTEATDPYGAFEYAWTNSISRGRIFRLYDDETLLSLGVYDAFTLRSLADPLSRSEISRVRWNVAIDANVYAEMPWANSAALVLDGVDDYVSCTDVATLDGATKATWSWWDRKCTYRATVYP